MTEEIRVSKEDLGLELEPGIVNRLSVRVVYQDQDKDGETISRAETVLCHFWQMEGDCACFYREMGGRIVKVRVVNMPVQVMEVEG
jgi:hypothetical protein